MNTGNFIIGCLDILIRLISVLTFKYIQNVYLSAPNPFHYTVNNPFLITMCSQLVDLKKKEGEGEGVDIKIHENFHLHTRLRNGY